MHDSHQTPITKLKILNQIIFARSTPKLRVIRKIITKLTILYFFVIQRGLLLHLNVKQCANAAEREVSPFDGFDIYRIIDKTNLTDMLHRPSETHQRSPRSTCNAHQWGFRMEYY